MIRKKNLCIFAHYDRNNIIDPYVIYYLREISKSFTDIIFVTTSSFSHAERDKIKGLVLRIIERENLSSDIGSYRDGVLSALDDLDSYDKVVIANDSVYGPFFELSGLIDFGEKEGFDIWGATDSRDIEYHLQSYFIVYGNKVIRSQEFKDFWRSVIDIKIVSEKDKRLLIENYEIGGSQYFIKKGFRLGALCSVSKTRDQISKNLLPKVNDKKVSTWINSRKEFFNEIPAEHLDSINPTHHMWDILILLFNFPFLKREVILLNPVRLNFAHWEQVIEKISNYPVELINNHLSYFYKVRVANQLTIFKTSWLFDPLHIPNSSIVLPRFLGLILEIFRDLSDHYEVGLRSEEEALNLIAWWESPGKNDFPGIVWPSKDIQIDYPKQIFEIDDNIYNEKGLKLTKGLVAIWRTRKDFQKNIDLKTSTGQQNLINWAREYGVNEYGFLAVEKINKQSVLSQHEEKPQSGVNVIGFLQAEIGIGEDARMSLSSLEHEKINCQAVNPPIKLTVRENINDFDRFLGKDQDFKANLFCIPAIDTLRTLLVNGTEIFDNRYNIGAWQWELPFWPKKWNPLFNLLNEVWAISKYTQEIFENSSPIPVIYTSMAVTLPLFQKKSREYFHLQKDKFLFLVMFDGNSWITRKNPIAAVKAFKNAFQNSRDVGLVIKTMNINVAHPMWIEILNIIQNDERIHVINNPLDRGDLYALIDCCDAYMSLHRSEGFGRIIAESMLIGKPVVVTNFSGNTDFTKSDTSFLVNGPLIPLSKEDYNGWEGQHWCDPSIDEATEQLIICFESSSRRTKISENGKNYIERYHSVGNIGSTYKKRLEFLGII